MSQLQGLVPNSGTTPAQSQAIAQLTANGQAGNPYAPAVGNVATSLLNGGGATAQAPNVQSNLGTFQSQLTPYANGSMIGNNPALQAQLAQIQTDVGNQVNSQFAGAGRSFSGMNQQELGRGIAQGEAPVIAGQYNQDVANQMNAANSLYGAGNTTSGLLSGMNQQGLVNQQAGIGAANSALAAQNYGPNAVIHAQQLAQSIPAQNLGLLANIGIPLAELGRTANGTATQQNDPSLLQNIQGWTNVAGNVAGMFGGL